MQYSCCQFCEGKVQLHAKCQNPTAGTGHAESLTDAQGVTTMLQQKICKAASLYFGRMERDFLFPAIDVNLVTFGSNFLFVLILCWMS